MIKAIVFDFFGVFTVDLFDSFLDRSVTGWREREAFFHSLSRQVDTGEITLEEFDRLVQQATGVESNQVGPMMMQGFALNKGLVDYIAGELKGKYKVGLLSNANKGWLDGILEKYDLSSLFDVETISSDIGFAKPDPQMYQAAAKALGVDFDEMVFIDDREQYAAGAAQLGIHAIVYRDLDQLKAALSKELG